MAHKTRRHLLIGGLFETPKTGPLCEPTIAGLTHVGMVRESNQDQFLVAKLERTLGVLSSSLHETESKSISGGLHDALLLMPWMRAMSEGQDVEFTKNLEQALEQGQQRKRKAAQRKHMDKHQRGRWSRQCHSGLGSILMLFVLLP